MAHTVYLTDGSFDWSGGVDSSKVTTIETSLSPHGLKRNQLAWMNNCTVRGGGILQRTGWQPNGTVHDGSKIFQGGFLYEPRDGSDPYFIFSIGGHIIQYVIDTAVVRDLSVYFGLFNPEALDQSFFVQGEEFLIIQAGDGVTLPLFWDGAILRRSLGLSAPYPATKELPAATCMDYYMGRIWYAQGRTYGAGDIVGSSASGTAPYNFRDSILKVTENPLCLGGDNFTVPSNAGNIRAIKHCANINNQLGESDLFVSTRKAVYSLNVPITRANWIAADSNNQPVQKIAQLNNGWVNDRSVVAVNGDLFGQSLEPSIRSLRTAVRNFDEWGNLPISNNEQRAMQFNNRALMRLASGIQFDNRLWQAVLPEQRPQGVIHKAIAVLDFDVISSLEQATSSQTPAWEGIYEGQNVLQLFTGDFSGLERAFAAVVSETDGSIDVWEMTTSSRTENGDNRVVWSFETPAYNFSKEFELKQLMGAEIWLSKIFGTIEMQVFYRTDSDPCYRFWHYHKDCVARECAEDGISPSCPNVYPYPGPGATYREGYRWTVNMPKPKGQCDSMGIRPSDIGYQFQLRIVIKGWCQVRGIMLYAAPYDKSIYQGLSCG